MTGLRVAISLSLGLLSSVGAILSERSYANSQTTPVRNQPLVAQTVSDRATSLVLHVNPVNGNNDRGDGSDRAPFKTITHALQVAQPNTVILLVPGTYSVETGESFPIALQPRITIQGNPENRGEDVIIRGGGAFSSPILAQKSITILGGANQTTLTGVTVTNPNPDGYGLQIESSSPTITDSTFTNNGRGGIVVVGKSAPIIRNNFISQTDGSGISIHHTSQPQIQENIFEQTGSAIIVNQNATPLIVGNRITRNKTGIVVQDNAQPKLRNNSVESNEQDGLMAIAQSRPDLGTASDPGSNFFRNNGQYDINTEKTSQIITALGNELVKTVGNLYIRETEAVKPKPIVISKPVPTPGAIAPAPIQPKPTTPSSQTPKPLLVPTVSSPSRTSEPPLPDRAQKAPVVVPKLTVAATQKSIPFGARLSFNQDKASSKVVLDSPKPTPQTTILATGIEQQSAPKQPDIPKQNTVNSAIVPVKLAEENSTPPFPIPVALSNRAPDVKGAPRPMQIVRMATPQRSLPSANTPPVNMPSANVVVAPVAAITTPKPVKPAVRETPPPAPNASVPLVYVRPTLSQKINPPAPGLGINRATPAIAIPVPPPESAVIAPPIQKAPPVPTSVTPITPVADSRSTAANLLPVPSSNIPVGNIGDMPSVYVSRNPSLRQAGPNPPSPPSQFASANVRYRVLVEMRDESQQEQVRSLIPDAFPVFYGGRSVMQVGAFGDRTKAVQLAEMLADQGLQSSIDP